jgi:hypothetical protein
VHERRGELRVWFVRRWHLGGAHVHGRSLGQSAAGVSGVSDPRVRGDAVSDRRAARPTSRATASARAC